MNRAYSADERPPAPAGSHVGSPQARAGTRSGARGILRAVRVCPRCKSIYAIQMDFCGIDGSRIVEQDEDPLVGRTLDRYRIIERLSEGAMGSVYRATHSVLKYEYAIKVLFGDVGCNQTFVERLRREAESVSMMRHPNIVAVLDFGTTPEGLTFLVMEHVQGRTLDTVLREEGPFPPARAARIARQIASGLAEAHRLGFVHRDVKPANIMLADTPTGGGTIKILDFGVVALEREPSRTRLTGVGHIIGTPTYMAPEQGSDSAVTFAADLYSLGVILYEMLAGFPPFSSPWLTEVLVKHITEPPPPLPASGGLERLAAWLLEKTPHHRPRSALEVVQEIEKLELHAAAFEAPLIEPATRLDAITEESSTGSVAEHSPAASRMSSTDPAEDEIPGHWSLWTEPNTRLGGDVVGTSSALEDGLPLVTILPVEDDAIEPIMDDPLEESPRPWIPTAHARRSPPARAGSSPSLTAAPKPAAERRGTAPSPPDQDLIDPRSTLIVRKRKHPLATPGGDAVSAHDLILPDLAFPPTDTEGGAPPIMVIAPAGPRIDVAPIPGGESLEASTGRVRLGDEPATDARAFGAAELSRAHATPAKMPAPAPPFEEPGHTAEGTGIASESFIEEMPTIVEPVSGVAAAEGITGDLEFTPIEPTITPPAPPHLTASEPSGDITIETSPNEDANGENKTIESDDDELLRLQEKLAQGISAAETANGARVQVPLELAATLPDRSETDRGDLSSVGRPEKNRERPSPQAGKAIPSENPQGPQDKKGTQYEYVRVRPLPSGRPDGASRRGSPLARGPQGERTGSNPRMESERALEGVEPRSEDRSPRVSRLARHAVLIGMFLCLAIAANEVIPLIFADGEASIQNEAAPRADARERRNEAVVSHDPTRPPQTIPACPTGESCGAPSPSDGAATSPSLLAALDGTPLATATSSPAATPTNALDARSPAAIPTNALESLGAHREEDANLGALAPPRSGKELESQRPADAAIRRLESSLEALMAERGLSPADLVSMHGPIARLWAQAHRARDRDERIAALTTLNGKMRRTEVGERFLRSKLKRVHESLRRLTPDLTSDQLVAMKRRHDQLSALVRPGLHASRYRQISLDISALEDDVHSATAKFE